MSTSASRVLRYGVTFAAGIVAAQLIAIGGVLVGDWWVERVRRG